MKCKICGSNEIKEVCDLATEKEILRVRKCEDCDVSFLLGKLSEDSFNRKAFLNKFVKNMENADGLSYDSRIEIVEKYRKLNTLLDFGCGMGGFLKEAKEKGWEVYGQEIDKDMIWYIKKQLKIKTCYNLSKKFDFKFDAIILWHAIEHVDNPILVIQKLLKYLRKGGVLIICCPNTSNFFYKLSQAIYFLSFRKITFFMRKVYTIPHRFYFNEESITNLLTNKGLKIKEIKGINMDLDKSIFIGYEKEFWVRFPITRVIVRIMNKLTKTHLEIICEK